MAYDMGTIMQTQDRRKDIHNIRRIFSYGRPAGTTNEIFFVNNFVMSPKFKELGAYKDGFQYHRGDDGEGNVILWIGDKETTQTLFSCHTDTVHRTDIMQDPYIDLEAMKFRVDSGQCLGGDDGSGIWLMQELIKAQVPGLYIFHRAEEVGGQGSSYIANQTTDLLKGMKRAIAFDRKDTWSVITHQAGGRCCSEAFSADFAEKLGMGHKSDTGGSFTDTANYTDYIPECTNMSVGYYSAHMSSENQDIEYLLKFRDALIKVDFESIVTERIPGIEEFSNTGYTGYNSTQLMRPPAKTRERMGWDGYDEAAFREAERKFKDTLVDDDDDLDAKEIMEMTESEYEEWMRKQEGLDDYGETDDVSRRITQDGDIQLLEFLNDWADWEDFLDERDILLGQLDDLGPKTPSTKEDIILEEFDEVEELPDSEFDWDSWFHGFN